MYLLVHDSVMGATSDVSVKIEPIGREIMVTVAGLAGPVPDHLTDRIGALGGTCRGRGSTLTAVLPCE